MGCRSNRSYLEVGGGKGQRYMYACDGAVRCEGRVCGCKLKV